MARPLAEGKAALFDHLRQRWQDLFQTRFDVLLYDLTSTYMEGEGEAIPKAKHGYTAIIGSIADRW